ncbi:AsmA family protein [Spirosoma koreense]
MKRTTKVLIALGILLIVARLLLPYFVLRYVNKNLADMGEYTGHVEGIDIHLIRGAYQIDDLRIRKVAGKIKEPFLFIPKIDLSVEWKSLFKGRLVSEVECYKPEINFAFSESEASSQTGAEVDWTAYLKKLLPININRFAVIDGTVNLTSLITQPRADLSLKQFQGEIRNIRNVEDKDTKLPSPVTATGNVPGYGGTMNFRANMNLLKSVPDFDYNLIFADLQLVKLNALARHYANIDFERGNVSVYSEMAMLDKKLNGYLKPLTKGMKIFKLNEHEHRSVGKFFTELIAQAGTAILKNQKHDQVATRIPLTGTIEDVKTPLWPTVFGVLRNAYIKAFRGEFDNNITLNDALKDFKADLKEKRAERKAERKEKRAERKAERKQKRAEKKAQREKEKR